MNVARARIRGRACLTVRIHVGTRACTRTYLSLSLSFLRAPARALSHVTCCDSLPSARGFSFQHSTRLRAVSRTGPTREGSRRYRFPARSLVSRVNKWLRFEETRREPRHEGKADERDRRDHTWKTRARGGDYTFQEETEHSKRLQSVAEKQRTM